MDIYSQPNDRLSNGEYTMLSSFPLYLNGRSYKTQLLIKCTLRRIPTVIYAEFTSTIRESNRIQTLISCVVDVEIKCITMRLYLVSTRITLTWIQYIRLDIKLRLFSCYIND